MAFELDIIVGGMCMFVQRESTGQLHILMPTMDHPGMVHHPWLYCGPTFGVGSDRPTGEERWIGLDGMVVDASGVGTASEPVMISRTVAPISHFANGKHINPACLLPGSLGGARLLAARVDLPLGGAIRPWGYEASVDVEYEGRTNPHELVGLATVSYAVEQDHVLLAGHKLYPDARQRLRIGLFNILASDRDAVPQLLAAFPRLPLIPPPTSVKPGDPVPHYHGYHPLLFGCTAGQQCGPIPTRRAPSWGAGSNDGLESEPLRMFFIDPYKCIVTVGCEPNALNC